MPTNELTGAVEYWMDLIGIFAFALSGAFLAVRKDFDIFGTVILAEAAGLGRVCATSRRRPNRDPRPLPGRVR
jgi:hypothetical protein